VESQRELRSSVSERAGRTHRARVSCNHWHFDTFQSLAFSTEESDRTRLASETHTHDGSQMNGLFFL